MAIVLANASEQETVVGKESNRKQLLTSAVKARLLNARRGKQKKNLILKPNHYIASLFLSIITCI